MLTPAPTNDTVPTSDPVNHQAGQTAVGVGVLAVAVHGKSRWRKRLDPAVLTGQAFADFVDTDFASLRATMVRAGMV